MRKESGTEVLSTILAIAICLMMGPGCAKISEPQPPEVHVPRPATDLAVQQISDSIRLTFALPLQNTDGSDVKTLERVEVFRLDEDTGQTVSTNPVPEDQFAKRAVRILSIPFPDISKYLQGESFVIEDRADPPDPLSFYSRTYRYAVLFINRKNQTAGFSNQALIAPVAIPGPPENFAAKVTENSIELKWAEPSENMDGSKPPRIAGYKIHRAEGTGEFSSIPIHPDLVRKSGFEDRDFQFDRLYRYVIRTVGSAGNPYAESLPSGILQVETRDVFPPAPPENFTAVREEDSIILLWAPSSSADVAGYRVYRQDNKTGARELLQKNLITVLNCRDSRAEPDRQYEYVIQAVDAHGNESTMVRAEFETR
ncbi:MAG: fibronectin type III domain-containing protein [Acidobacteria bacterium]|nr:fibronectin type III domain-containing protein [Acidobacteriota bacterium]